jgi:hypothetical protein
MTTHVPIRCTEQCPTCRSPQRMAGLGSIHNGPTITCTGCGTSWTNGRLIDQPVTAEQQAAAVVTAERLWAGAGEYTQADYETWRAQELASVRPADGPTYPACARPPRGSAGAGGPPESHHTHGRKPSMATYQPGKGDRVRVTRTRPDGTVKFNKTGTILAVHTDGYDFKDDDWGRRSLAGCADIAKSMPGWTQTIEPLAEQAGIPTRRWTA